jgi:hypothetical protein
MVEEGDATGLWPFDGALVDLLKSRSVVIVETYPTEFYDHLGFRLGSGKGNGKQSQPARQAVAKHLLTTAVQLGCEFSDAAHEAVAGGSVRAGTARTRSMPWWLSWASSSISTRGTRSTRQMNPPCGQLKA